MNETFAILLMVFSTILSALGQLSLKIGSMKLEKKISSILKNYVLIIGIFLYGVSTLITVIALRGNELSVLYPIASLNYVWVIFLSSKYLNEKINALKISGIMLIIIGVLLIV